MKKSVFKSAFRFGLLALAFLGGIVFSTAAQSSAGDVFLEPAASTVELNAGFSVAVKVNSGTQKVAAYGINISYDSSIIQANTDIGNSGVEAGLDGYISAVNPNTNTGGPLVISGFDVSGKGPGAAMDFLKVNFVAIGEGSSAINVTVNSLSDSSYLNVGTPNGIGGSVTVTDVLLGDVNGSGVVDIVDALMTAQYYVGLNPPGFNVAAADANADGVVNIVDALVIAQYYVGLIPSLPPGGTQTTPTPPPVITPTPPVVTPTQPPVVTPTPVPPTPATGDLRLTYKCAESNSSASQIKPWFIIHNDSGSPVSYSDLTVRYFFSKEGKAEEQVQFDYVQIGSGNLSGTTGKGYMEVSFAAGAGQLAAGSSSGEIQPRINMSDWSQYNQSNDCSFDPSLTNSFGENLGMALYLKGVLVYGGVCGTPVPTAVPTPTLTPPPTSPPGSVVHVENPFAVGKWYVDPVWSQKAIDGGGAAVATYNTAVWLDRIGAITDGIGLRGHLDAALDQGAEVIMIVVYDLPNRDCAAAASNGELRIDDGGFNRYMWEYIDPIKAIVADVKYKDLNIVCVIEVDSLPNLVTNLDLPECAEANGPGGYVDGIRYALNQLSMVPNVYNYLDIAHSGWLGWDSNLGPSATLITNCVKGTNKGVNSIDGFVSNTANYTPTEEIYLPDPNLQLQTGSMAIKSADFYEWNPVFDETDFTKLMYDQFVAKGFPTTIGMLIDTSRNGWGGANRPSGPSTSTNINIFVDESRLDRRYHRGNWCNQGDAGIGERPQANPGPSHLDAYVWVKPPGESDGISDPNFTPDPNDPAKQFDLMCDPDGMNKYCNCGTTGSIDAPHAGRWNQLQFDSLLANAWPPL